MNTCVSKTQFFCLLIRSANGWKYAQNGVISYRERYHNCRFAINSYISKRIVAHV